MLAIVDANPSGQHILSCYIDGSHVSLTYYRLLVWKHISVFIFNEERRRQDSGGKALRVIHPWPGLIAMPSKRFFWWPSVQKLKEPGRSKFHSKYLTPNHLDCVSWQNAVRDASSFLLTIRVDWPTDWRLEGWCTRLDEAQPQLRRGYLSPKKIEEQSRLTT